MYRHQISGKEIAQWQNCRVAAGARCDSRQFENRNTIVNIFRRVVFIFIFGMFCTLSHAITLKGKGTISAKQQRELETYIQYFGRASIFVEEYCYFDDDGIPVNTGKCIAHIPESPNYLPGGGGAEYARQFSGTPLGKEEADPEKDIHYLYSFPEVWLACNNRRAFGCTYTERWPLHVTILLTTYDKQLGNITLRHEIEYHAKRNIKH